MANLAKKNGVRLILLGEQRRGLAGWSGQREEVKPDGKSRELATERKGVT